MIDALRNYYEHDNANVHRGLHMLSARATEAYEKARQRVADYIGAASAEEIIFTRGTTESINLVAQAWGEKFIREGDVILLTEMEHHSNLVPWQLLAERTGARLRFVPVRDDGTLELEQLSALLTPEVKLFAFHPHLKLAGHNQSGQPSFARERTQSARSRWSMPRKARDTCQSMCASWAAISWPFPDTRCVDRRASACSTGALRSSIRCRPGMAAAK